MSDTPTPATTATMADRDPNLSSESRQSLSMSKSKSSGAGSRRQPTHRRSSARSDPFGESLSPHASFSSEEAMGRRASAESTASMDPAFEVDFEEDDKENPRQWPAWYKSYVVFVVSFAPTCVVLFSTAYASGTEGMMQDFNITDETIVVLGITTYMIGLALGCIVLGPLSEMYGRKPVYIVSQIIFTIMVVPSAVAQNLQTVLVCRLVGAFPGAALISNSPGSVTDVTTRSLVFSLWSIGPFQGPVWGPVIGGFVYEKLGWRWINWLILIWAVVALASLLSIKETYAPRILRQRAAKKRKETGDSRYWSRYDDKKTLKLLLRENLSRPFVMAVTEPICMFWHFYVAVVYAILYLCFVAYPIVFQQERGWSPGLTGLSYLGIGIGGLLIIFAEPLCSKLVSSHKPEPETGRPPPEAMVSIICICAILAPIGQLLFAWTCTPNVHWIVPIIAGVFFGAGNTGVFIYAASYLVRSYGIFAASAMAGNTFARSIGGAALPLAGPLMYRNLGANWAGTLLGLLEVVLIPIPFVFYRYGHKIRERSTWIRRLRADQDRLQNKTRPAAQDPSEQQGSTVENASSDGSEKEKEKVDKDESKV